MSASGTDPHAGDHHGEQEFVDHDTMHITVGGYVTGFVLSGRELVAGAVILASVALIVSSGGLRRTDAGAGSEGGEQRRAEVQPELPFEGGGRAQQRLLAQDGRGELEPDGKPG